MNNTQQPKRRSFLSKLARRDSQGFSRSASPSSPSLQPNGTANGTANGTHLQNGHLSMPASEPEPHPRPHLAAALANIENAFTQLGALQKAYMAPLPQTGDGTALPQAAKPSLPKDLANLFRDIGREDIKDVEGLVSTVTDTALGRPLRDRQYLMEHMIRATANLPDDALQKTFTNTFLTTLWKDLQHPPQTLLGDQSKFRQPDGSNNCYLVPHIGAARTPYARTVAPKTTQKACLPDAGVLFDAVMARKNTEGTPHPARISSMLFYLASIIIHDIFRTDHRDPEISNTSSYLDLAPLYGSNWEEQKRMRTLQDGKIKPDCFSETRLLTFPPGVGALLIMFNRYHNYVVEQLASINEDNRFSEDPRNITVERYGEKLNKRDDDLFQTARLITCGLYVNIILIDYVRTILNLNRTDSNWQLNPRADIPGGPPVGTGNQCSAEFNLVYRWHSAISQRDDAWTQQLFKELPLPPDMKSPEAVADPKNMGQFLGMLAGMEDKLQKLDPTERQFPALQSEKLERVSSGPYEGNYRDDDLAAILTSSIEDCANAMGPQQVPAVMKAIEILGIQQARTWKCATLNEFRKHFALNPHETWADITVNPEVQNALKHLYDTPDQVELYPGLVVEDAKIPLAPGSGLCPSYTVSRGVLSDAVALVRGDRFYTSSYSPAALTNWGFQEASSDLTIDNGCVFYKLFLRALPNSYDPGSVYVHYPMTVPDEMERVLRDLEKASLYNFDRPTPIAQPVVVFSHDAAMQVLNNPDTYKVTWGPAMEFLMGKSAKNFMLAGDGPANQASRNLMEKPMYMGGSSRAMPTGTEPWLAAVKTFYEDITTRLLQEKSLQVGQQRHVDLIRDVGNLAHVHFAAEVFGAPLKTEKTPHGVVTEHELYLVMAAVFICIFFDLDPPKSFPLRQQARAATQQIGALMQAQVLAIRAGGKAAAWFLEWAEIAPPSTAGPLRDYGLHMIQQLCKLDRSTDDLVWGNIMGTFGGMVANQGQLFGQVLDYFFTDPGRAHWPAVQALARENTPAADDTLMHYLMEAARLNGETGVFRYTTAPTTLTDTTAALGTRSHALPAGAKVMVDLRAAGRDPVAFPDPDALDLTRPLDSYIVLGHGRHQCFGLPMTRVALTTMLKVIAKLDNLHPAPVAVGGRSQPSRVKKVLKEFEPGSAKIMPESWHYHEFLTEDWDMYWPFPQNLKVSWTP